MVNILQALALTLGFLIAFGANAGPSSGFLCEGKQPYDHFSIVNTASASRILFSSSPRRWELALQGKIPDGQSPIMRDSRGLMAVPVVRDGAPFVDVFYEGRKVATKAGALLEGDINEVGTQVLLLSTYSIPTMGDKTSVTQAVVDRFGRTIASRIIKATLSEGGTENYRLASDGSGLYRILSQDSSSAIIEVLDSRSFKSRLKMSFDGRRFTDVVMLSSYRGFAIIEGKLFSIDKDGLSPIRLANDRFYANQLTADARSGRLLVQGVHGFYLLDLDGHELFNASGLYSAKITIEGNVAYFGAGIRAPVMASKRNGYRTSAATKIPPQAWNNIACLTESSIAMTNRSSSGESFALSVTR